MNYAAMLRDLHDTCDEVIVGMRESTIRIGDLVTTIELPALAAVTVLYSIVRSFA